MTRGAFSGANGCCTRENPVNCAYRSANHLIPTRLDHIAHEIGGVVHAAPSLVIDPLFTASRDTSPRALFVALRGLQALARWHRHEYFERVLAITGSNGKTLVKDALKTLLAGRQVLASPGSYNSQLGLPLAVLAAEKPELLAILEAGISEPGEMSVLEEIARPDYGILTNIGLAHVAAFGSREAIAREKMKLFERLPKDGWLLLPADEPTL